MVPGNLREVLLDVGWNMGLMNNALRTLALTWPHLETLFVNEIWGWNTLCGITSNGLVQLLQACRSLRQVSLALDTRGYTELPPIRSLADLGLRLTRLFKQNLRRPSPLFFLVPRLAPILP